MDIVVMRIPGVLYYVTVAMGQINRVTLEHNCMIVQCERQVEAAYSYAG